MQKGENIYKRKDGRFEGRYVKGRDQDGRTKYGYVYGHSLQEVRTKLYPKKIEYQGILQRKGLSCMTVHEWSMNWLTEIQMEIKPATYTSYYHKITKYIFPLLGSEALNELTQEKGVSFIQKLQENALKATTIRVIFQVFNRCLNVAVKRGYLKRNPFLSVKVPKIRKERVRALTLVQQRNLEKAALAEKNGRGLPVLIALYAGLRVGEISALRWENIDFEKNVIHVEHTCQRISSKKTKSKTRLICESPKTVSSSRTIPLSHRLKVLLSQYKKEKKATSGFILSKKDHPVEPRLITYHFHKIRKKAGTTDIHFHQLRHTFATRCLEAQGDVPTVSALLGHTSTQMTLDVYSDSLMEQRIHVIDLLDKKWVG